MFAFVKRLFPDPRMGMATLRRRTIPGLSKFNPTIQRSHRDIQIVLFRDHQYASVYGRDYGASQEPPAGSIQYDPRKCRPLSRKISPGEAPVEKPKMHGLPPRMDTSGRNRVPGRSISSRFTPAPVANCCAMFGTARLPRVGPVVPHLY